MVDIIINNISYPLPESWQKLNLRQVQSVAEYAELLNDTHPVAPAKRDEAAANLLSEICGVPQEIATQTDPNDRNHFAYRYCHWALNNPTAPASGSADKAFQHTFHWQGEWLRYPASGIDINGDGMPMYEVSAVEFCTASDLYLADALGYAPLIVALLCRPAGEPYSETQARQRAQTMRMLPMTVVLHVFGLLDQTHRCFKQLFPHCYAPQGIHRYLQEAQTASQIPSTRPLRDVSSATWNDLLLEAAAYRPGEITVTEQMPLYDFMRLLNAKFKRYRPSNL